MNCQTDFFLPTFLKCFILQLEKKNGIRYAQLKYSQDFRKNEPRKANAARWGKCQGGKTPGIRMVKRRPWARHAGSVRAAHEAGERLAKTAWVFCHLGRTKLVLPKWEREI